MYLLGRENIHSKWFYDKLISFHWCWSQKEILIFIHIYIWQKNVMFSNGFEICLAPFTAIWMTLSSISCKAILVVTNCFSSCLSGNVKISWSFLKEHFAIYRNSLCFSFNILNMQSHSLWPCRFCPEKSDNFTEDPLYVMSHLAAFIIVSLSLCAQSLWIYLTWNLLNCWLYIHTFCQIWESGVDYFFKSTCCMLPFCYSPSRTP